MFLLHHLCNKQTNIQKYWARGRQIVFIIPPHTTSPNVGPVHKLLLLYLRTVLPDPRADSTFPDQQDYIQRCRSVLSLLSSFVSVFFPRRRERFFLAPTNHYQLTVFNTIPTVEHLKPKAVAFLLVLYICFAFMFGKRKDCLLKTFVFFRILENHLFISLFVNFRKRKHLQGIYHKSGRLERMSHRKLENQIIWTETVEICFGKNDKTTHPHKWGWLQTNKTPTWENDLRSCSPLIVFFFFYGLFMPAFGTRIENRSETGKHTTKDSKVYDFKQTEPTVFGRIRMRASDWAEKQQTKNQKTNQVQFTAWCKGRMHL